MKPLIDSLFNLFKKGNKSHPSFKGIIFLLLIFLQIQNTFSQINYTSEIFALANNIEVFNANPCINIENSKRLEFDEEMKVNIVGYEKCKRTTYFKIILNELPYYIRTNELKFNFLEEEIIQMLRKSDEFETNTFCQLNSKENIKFYKQKEEEKKVEEKLKYIEEQRIIEEDKKRREQIEFQNSQILLAQKDSVKTSENQLILKEFAELHSKRSKAIDELKTFIVKEGGVFITQFDVLTTEYDVTSVTLGVINLSKKRIKYISFILQALNPVNDQIGGLKTVKAVGFIDSDDIGTFEFENIWFENTLESVKILKMKIEYEDGTFKSVTNLNEKIITNSDVAISLIQNKKSETFEFESLILIENTSFEGVQTHEIIFSPIYYDNEKFVRTIKLFDYNLWITDIERVLKAKRNQEVVKTDFFETTNYSTLIYLVFNYEKTLISVDSLEAFLIKLKTL